MLNLSSRFPIHSQAPHFSRSDTDKPITVWIPRNYSKENTVHPDVQQMQTALKAQQEYIASGGQGTQPSRYIDPHILMPNEYMSDISKTIRAHSYETPLRDRENDVVAVATHHGIPTNQTSGDPSAKGDRSQVWRPYHVYTGKAAQKQFEETIAFRRKMRGTPEE